MFWCLERGMNVQKHLREWIASGLDQPGRTQVGLARAIGKDPATITKILAGTRRIQADEIAIAAKYLALDPPTVLPSSVRSKIEQVMVMGRIADVWIDRVTGSRISDAYGVAAILDDRYPASTQSAYIATNPIEGLTIFPETAFLTVAWDQYRVSPLAGDFAVFEVRRAAFVGFGLSRYTNDKWEHVAGQVGGAPVALVIGMTSRAS